MKKALLISCFSIFLLACSESEEISTKEKVETVSMEDQSLESIKLKIYKAAILNESTIQDFVVVKVYNKITVKQKKSAQKVTS